MTLTEIPGSRPSTPLLDSIDSPAELRALDADLLPQVCAELREFLLYSVGQSGGHFAAGLGVVELTVALHHAFNTPEDRLVWDVGHQAYPHKILTGRREQMPSIRSAEGPAAFPLREESEYDTFGVGHSSTSIGAALGMALALRAQQKEQQTVAIIGDGAMSAGMAFEALNHAGHVKADMLVILNDNDMSISNNVGALNKYFTRIWSSRTYSALREGSKRVLEKIPAAWEFARRTEEHMKGMVAPGTLFEELGFNYYGPIDGHDLDELLLTLQNLKKLKGPRFLHVVTRKGKGFQPAEDDPIKYHALKGSNADAGVKMPSYSNVFGNWLCDMAAADERLMGITPAMREGSDLIRFSQEFPERYFDVAIAEQHAVTLAAGLACEGAKPVVAIYSTFLQRAYDQLIHDVALQNLDVLFAIDRAGLVGEDGPTHHGAYDLSYLRCIPNMVVMTPSDENECRQMLYTGYQHEGPAAVRYPRGCGTGVEPTTDMQALALGKGIIRREGNAVAGKRVAILAFGAPLREAQLVAATLDASVADMRFVKPLDTELVLQLAADHDLLVTLEENAVMGGAGSAVLEALAAANVQIPVLTLGIPDRYIEHASPAQQQRDIALDTDSLLSSIRSRLAQG
ncbi:1-deoxy-D-xylulose-5-phosphate synthase [Thalassolituus alkanivorans]|uniref:1-deoxy-D-xylulose-5-phosphate synthase n=1 Tax=Thalassolituus alkanivorans TaxID=2881055 RepID=UPI001E621D37|nr:1-deoxy-D-xylulose-5-phosphate synthase [Thalassolituus alkanivorans]MCB2386258.1 1-deoxy-D-xylulose-5-phosphate synthase [Thalassolituus alkanivorans]MCB2424311.1 1-deoxy-D-xylulose-5-phosphate synthase [Thalassolituus alkanivorans]